MNIHFVLRFTRFLRNNICEGRVKLMYGDCKVTFDLLPLLTLYLHEGNNVAFHYFLDVFITKQIRLGYISLDRRVTYLSHILRLTKNVNHKQKSVNVLFVFHLL